MRHREVGYTLYILNLDNRHRYGLLHAPFNSNSIGDTLDEEKILALAGTVP
jgi:hypothetical protein